MALPPWREMIRPLDVIIAAAGLMLAVGSGSLGDGGPGRPAMIVARVDGLKVAQWRFPDAGHTRSDTVAGAMGGTVFETTAGRVVVIETSCPREWCRFDGDLTPMGGAIVCAPNRLVLTVSDGRTDERIDAVTQ